MAIIFCDGFDYYSRTKVCQKWTWTSSGPEGGPGGGECFVINTTWKKTGAQSGGVTNGWVKKALGSNYPTLYAGFWEKSSTNVAMKIWSFGDNGTVQVGIRRTAEGALAAYRGDTLLGTTAETGLVTAAECHLQFRVVFHPTAGAVEVRVNDIPKLLLQNINTSATGNAYANEVSMESNYGGATVYYDDLWVDDAEFLGTAQIYTLYPNGAGAVSQWTPSLGLNYDCVNENNDDIDYVIASTPGVKDMYTLDNLIPTTGTVKAVQVSWVARKTDSGNRVLTPIIKPGATEVEEDNFELFDVYTPRRILYLKNPDGLKSWRISAVNDLQVGIKLIE